MTGATRPDIPAVTSPAPDPSGPPAASTAPSVPVSGAGHGPGPRRMVGRQVAPQECLACGQRWPCEGSWQVRAEAAEARLAEIEAHTPAIAAAGRYRSALVVIDDEEKS